MLLFFQETRPGQNQERPFRGEIVSCVQRRDCVLCSEERLRPVFRADIVSFAQRSDGYMVLKDQIPANRSDANMVMKD